MYRVLKVVFVTTSFSFITACGNFNAINKKFNPNNHQSISIDAEQRVVYSVEKKLKSGASWTAVCAEPSPDAISALSASFGADVESLEKALSLAGGSQKSAASIGIRTQTIQILRDAMYRLCEGYASGALDDVKYGQAQRRYQDTMLALLAIEQLTGVVAANQAAISSRSDSVSSRGVESLSKWIEASREELAAKDAELKTLEGNKTTSTQAFETAKTEYDKLVSEAGDDEEKKAAAAKYLTDTLEPAQVAATTASAAFDTATQEKSKIEESISELEEAQKSISLAVSKQAGVVELQGGSTASRVNEKTVETLSKAVVKIVESTQTNHNTPDFCYDVMKEAVESEEIKRTAYLKTFSDYCAVAMNALAKNSAK